MKRSVGIAIFKKQPLRIFLVRPGGPYYDKHPDNSRIWTFPKGETEPSEDPATTAIREFYEETGYDISNYKDQLISLGDQKTNSKINTIYALHLPTFPDNYQVISNLCEIEYPSKSNKFISFPEITKGSFFTYADAHNLIFKNQLSFLPRLSQLLIT